MELLSHTLRSATFPERAGRMLAKQCKGVHGTWVLILPPKYPRGFVFVEAKQLQKVLGSLVTFVPCSACHEGSTLALLFIEHLALEKALLKEHSHQHGG